MTSWRATFPGALEAIRAELEQAVAAQPEVRLSSAELYATHSSTAFRNSRGLSGAYDGTHASLDLALLARAGDQEAEFHAMIARRRLADLQIARTVAVYGAYARDVLRALRPRRPTMARRFSVATRSGLRVGASAWRLCGLLSPIAFQTSGQAASL